MEGRGGVELGGDWARPLRLTGRDERAWDLATWPNRACAAAWCYPVTNIAIIVYMIYGVSDQAATGTDCSVVGFTQRTNTAAGREASSEPGLIMRSTPDYLSTQAR